MTTKVRRIEELQVGDVIWDHQTIVVTEVTQMSASTVVWGRRIDGPVPPDNAQHGGGNVQWLLQFGYPVLTTREEPA